MIVYSWICFLNMLMIIRKAYNMFRGRLNYNTDSEIQELRIQYNTG